MKAPRAFVWLLLRVSFWLSLAAVVLVLKLTEAALPIAGDQGIYSVIGQGVLDGRVPYRDFWEQKPPGVFYLRAAVLALAPRDWLTPCLPGPLRVSCPWLALQLADYLYTLAFAVAVFFTGRAAGFRQPPAMLAALIGALSVSLVRVSQQGLTPEKLVLLPATLAVFCALRGSVGKSWWWLGAGVAVATVALAKQSGATVLLPVLLLALFTPGQRLGERLARLGLTAIGITIPLALVAAALAAQGALDPMLEYAFLLNLQRFTVSSELNAFGGDTAFRDAWEYFKDGLAPFWLLGFVGVLAALGSRERTLLVLAAWATVDTALLTRLREYLQLSPSYALLGGWALYRLWLASGRSPHFGMNSAWAARALVATWLGATIILSSSLQGSVMMRVVNERGLLDFLRSPDEWAADEIRKLPPGPLYVWGNAAHLYLYTGRPVASRYLNNTVLTPGWRGSDQARAALFQELAGAQPAVIVVNPTIYWEYLAVDRYPELVRMLETGYSQLPADPARFGGWRIYQRRAGQSSIPPADRATAKAG